MNWRNARKRVGYGSFSNSAAEERPRKPLKAAARG